MGAVLQLDQQKMPRVGVVGRPHVFIGPAVEAGQERILVQQPGQRPHVAAVHVRKQVGKQRVRRAAEQRLFVDAAHQRGLQLGELRLRHRQQVHAGQRPHVGNVHQRDEVHRRIAVPETKHAAHGHFPHADAARAAHARQQHRFARRHCHLARSLQMGRDLLVEDDAVLAGGQHAPAHDLDIVGKHRRVEGRIDAKDLRDAAPVAVIDQRRGRRLRIDRLDRRVARGVVQHAGEAGHRGHDGVHRVGTFRPHNGHVALMAAGDEQVTGVAFHVRLRDAPLGRLHEGIAHDEHHDADGDEHAHDEGLRFVAKNVAKGDFEHDAHDVAPAFSTARPWSAPGRISSTTWPSCRRMT